MKKFAVILLAIVALLLVAGLITGAFFWKRLAAPSVRPEAIVPADTLFLAELVDLSRSGFRWRDSDLFKLWQEPEMQAFLEKPLATYPPFLEAQKLTGDLTKLWPRQAFIAVTGMVGNTPKIVGGFSYQGDQKMAERLLAEPRQQMKQAHPAGRAEIIAHGKIEIQTYTDEEFILAEADHAGWHLAASDVETLKATLDRLDRSEKPTEPMLAGEADYLLAQKTLPPDPDLRLFARTGVFVDRVASALSAGSPDSMAGWESLRNVRALAATSKLEEGKMRDSVFTMAKAAQPGATAPPALARQALELSTPETALFYAAQITGDGLAKLPEEARQMVPFIPALDAALKHQGATLTDLATYFGPEIAFLSQKPAAGVTSTAFALSLRDAKKAAQLAEGLTSPELGPLAWTAAETGGQHLYASPAASPFLPVSLQILPTDRYWLLGFKAEALVTFAQRKAGTPQLDSVAGFREQAGKIVSPTDSFGYLDLGGLLETYYNTYKSIAALGIVGSAELGKYLDAGKLPSGAVLNRHLGQLVFAQGNVAEGTLWEARGSLSPTPIFAATLAGVISNREALGSMMGGLALPGLLNPAGIPGANGGAAPGSAFPSPDPWPTSPANKPEATPPPAEAPADPAR